MASELDFPARGKVTGVKDGKVVFNPANTNYELHLEGKYDGPVNTLIDCHIRATARKVYSVPSGGNFITPIFGPPKIVQGRVRYASEKLVVIQAGCPVIVTLPADANAIDLNNGPFGAGSLVNAVCLPGATFELATQPAMK